MMDSEDRQTNNTNIILQQQIDNNLQNLLALERENSWKEFFVLIQHLEKEWVQERGCWSEILSRQTEIIENLNKNSSLAKELFEKQRNKILEFRKEQIKEIEEKEEEILSLRDERKNLTRQILEQNKNFQIQKDKHFTVVGAIGISAISIIAALLISLFVLLKRKK